MKPPTTHQRLIQLVDVLDLWIEHPTDEPRHFDTDDLRLLPSCRRCPPGTVR